MLTMRRSGDSTHRCRSPTLTVNGRDLTLPSRTQTPEQEYRRPSTPCLRNTPQSGRMLSPELFSRHLAT